MHLWQLNKWRTFYSGIECRRGFRIRCDKAVDEEIKQAILNFGKWVRREFDFPIRVVAYIKSTERIRAKDGELVSATFFGPFDRALEPYIRVSAGDFHKLTEKWGKDEAIAATLRSLAHELSHYYQWLNDLKLTPIGEERQATSYAYAVVEEYKEETGIL